MHHLSNTEHHLRHAKLRSNLEAIAQGLYWRPEELQLHINTGLTPEGSEALSVSQWACGEDIM